jgi:hypothetical protein
MSAAMVNRAVNQAIPSDVRGGGTSATGYDGHDADRVSARTGVGATEQVAEQGDGALDQALDQARHWVRRAQGVVFYAGMLFGALALVGVMLFVLGVFLAIPFPGVRALWGLPATLLWGGIGGVMGMVVVAVTLYALRHALEDARWALSGGGERLED